MGLPCRVDSQEYRQRLLAREHLIYIGSFAPGAAAPIIAAVVFPQYHIG
tara:strand:- start:267 stop:413 length:147 start_codon:yes stop_codon:yes gene_type:complete